MRVKGIWKKKMKILNNLQLNPWGSGVSGCLVGLERFKDNNYYSSRLFMNIVTLFGMCLETFWRHVIVLKAWCFHDNRIWQSWLSKFDLLSCLFNEMHPSCKRMFVFNCLDFLTFRRFGPVSSHFWWCSDITVKPRNLKLQKILTNQRRQNVISKWYDVIFSDC